MGLSAKDGSDITVGPKRGASSSRIFAAFALSLAFFAVDHLVLARRTAGVVRQMAEASRLMEKAEAALRACREERGLEIDSSSDVNRTGLIGLRSSLITTSLGSLPAKRTAADPNMAGLLIYLLTEAGVRRGDAVAVGASGSFPGLIVAVLSAARALELRPLVICSLGASMWGANDPDFHCLDIMSCLRRVGLVEEPLLALSLGGGRDVGEGMEPKGRELLAAAAAASGLPVLDETDLAKNVSQRMSLYMKAAEGKPIKAFINIGGSWANMGTDEAILDVEPGLSRVEHIPEPENRGVLQEMASRRIPVIHCLHLAGLVRRFGMAWDPVPLSRMENSRLFHRVRDRNPAFFLATGLYVLLLTAVFVFPLRSTGGAAFISSAPLPPGRRETPGRGG